MSNLILAGKPSVVRVLRARGNRLTIPEANRHIVYGEALIEDLIPLTWRCNVEFENGNSWEINPAACDLLHIDNADELQRRYLARLHANCEIEASPGDVIVVMPMFGDDGELAYPSRRCDCRQYLQRRRVVVAYVGAELPADIAQVFRKIRWQTVSAGPCESDLVRAVRERGSVNVSIFDAARMHFCLPGIEAFQQEHFPGRAEVEARELIPHLDNGYVARLVRSKLGLRQQNMSSISWQFADWELLRNQARPVARALGVDDIRWL